MCRRDNKAQDQLQQALDFVPSGGHIPGAPLCEECSQSELLKCHLPTQWWGILGCCVVFLSAASAEDGQSICVLKVFSYITKGNNGKTKAGCSTDTKPTITCRLNSCSTFLCQVWSPVKIEMFVTFCSLFEDATPAVDSAESGKYTHSDSPGSCLA